MNGMFFCCESLSSLPDISKWNTSNLENSGCMFLQCKKLDNIPKIEIKKEIKKKGFFEKLFW